jgi:K+ transporter
MSHKLKEKTHVLVIGALGVVFGDIGTSPLYALKVCFGGQIMVKPTPENVLGLVSLIFWSLTLVVSVKYALFIMQADDEGEGWPCCTKTWGQIWEGVWFLPGCLALPCYMGTAL